MANKYDYPFTDFPNDIVDTSRLSLEILDTTLSGVFTHINTANDVCKLWFSQALTAGQQTTLDGVVSAHDGKPSAALVAFSRYNMEAEEDIGALKAVYISDENKVSLASASSEDYLPCVGLTESSVSTGDMVTVYTNDVLVGFTGLTSGARYYLSQDTPGEITTTKPSSGIIVSIGAAKSSTELDIHVVRIPSSTDHDHTSSSISDWNESVDDRVSNLLVAGENIDIVYDDGANTLTISGGPQGPQGIQGEQGPQGIQGEQGEQGPVGLSGAGSTINIYDDGSAVSGTPFEAINFIGSTVSGSATISGGVDITPNRYTDEEAQDAVGSIMSGAGNVTVTYDDSTPSITISGSENVFGSEYHYAESEGISSTTSDTYIQKIRLTTSSLPAGTYRISWHVEQSTDKASLGVGIRVQLNDSLVLTDLVGQYPAPSEYFSKSGFNVEVLDAGVYNIDLDHKTQTGTGGGSNVKNARLEIWRVS